MGTGSANDLGNGGNEKETQLPQVSSPHAISDIRTHEYFDQFPRNSTKSEVPRNFPFSEFPQPAPGMRVKGYTYHGTESEIPRYFPPSSEFLIHLPSTHEDLRLIVESRFLFSDSRLLWRTRKIKILAPDDTS